MGMQVQVDLKYVKAERGRDGRERYWYFRRSGRRWRLPGEPLSATFMEAYQQLLAETAPAVAAPPIKPLPGSMKALAVQYYASPEFLERATATQRMYRMVIDPLVKKYGQDPIALIERRHVKRWRDERAETPGVANMVVKVASVLLKYAVENDYRRDNPATKIKLFKLGEWRAWTDNELAAYERRWAPGTMQRRAYALARYTGQRRGDLAAMTRASRQDGAIRVRQQKTGKTLLVHEHAELTAELARGEQGHMALLTQPSGEAFTPYDLSMAFGEWIEAAGLPDECVLHGLRKVAARDLADAGCTAHEIASVTGQSMIEVQRYTRAANQQKLAQAAILKLERSRKSG